MTEYDKTEQAYKNGYEAGKAESEKGKGEMIKRHLEKVKILIKENAELNTETEALKKRNAVKNYLNNEYKNQIKDIQAENAELKARLEKGTIPTKVYGIANHYGIKKGIHEISVEEISGKLVNGGGIYFEIDEIGKTIFLTREAAENHLAELKGEKK